MFTVIGIMFAGMGLGYVFRRFNGSHLFLSARLPSRQAGIHRRVTGGLPLRALLSFSPSPHWG